MFDNFEYLLDGFAAAFIFINLIYLFIGKETKNSVPTLGSVSKVIVP